MRAPESREAFPFSVSVGNVYDGPLDLLLDLIRKQDIDIYDIPIAQITAQYLGYVEHIRNFDIDLAAEFIYMASLLIHIKSKMLLPRTPALRPMSRTRASNWCTACSIMSASTGRADAAAEAADRRRCAQQSGAEGISQ